MNGREKYRGEPLFTQIEQISMVVHDAKKSARFLSDVYGIGPWLCVQFGDAGDGNQNWIPVEDVVLEGETVGSYCIDCAVCDLPSGVQLEIISPRSGDSVFSRFLKERGPGIQHLSVNNGNFEETRARIEAAGYHLNQTARIDERELCAFSKHIDVLGCYLEIHKRPEDFRYPEVVPEFIPGPGADDKPAATPLFRDIDQIGIVVEDVERAVRVLNDEYGIGPWVLLDFGDCGQGRSFVKTENVVLNGKSIDTFAAHAAICDALNVQIELIQPVSRQGVHADCLNRYGPMAQHVSLVSDIPFEELERRTNEAGFASGQAATIDTTETCLYSDHMSLLGLLLEAHKRPENFEPPKVDIKTYPPGLDLKL